MKMSDVPRYIEDNALIICFNKTYINNTQKSFLPHTSKVQQVNVDNIIMRQKQSRR